LNGLRRFLVRKKASLWTRIQSTLKGLPVISLPSPDDDEADDEEEESEEASEWCEAAS
jgi:hypothetical protein